MKTVVVVGVARSGTSMTCGLVNCLGVNIATNTPEPRQLRHNPKGMFEHKDFEFVFDINIKYKEDIDKHNLPDFNALQKEYKDTVNKCIETHGSDLWGFKSMGVYSLDVVVPLLPNPHIIAVSRNSLNNAFSFQTMTKVNENVTLPITQMFQEVTLANSVLAHSLHRLREHPIHFTTYESIKSQPLKEAEDIAEFLNINIDSDIKNKVEDFIDVNLHTWKKEKGKITPINPIS